MSSHAPAAGGGIRGRGRLTGWGLESLLGWLLAWSTVWGAEPPSPLKGTPPSAHSTPAPRLLYLRGGRVLSGAIERTGETYTVTQPQGSLVVPAEQVEFEAQSLAEIYNRRRQQLSPPTAVTHMELARWCLEHRLLHEAQVELRGALDLEPERDEARLMLARLASLDTARSAERTNTAVEPAPAVLERLAPSGVPLESLAGLTRDTGTTFVRRIQPLLINLCATAGCHGPHAPQEFRLSIVRPDSHSNRPRVEQNLAAVLQQIDTARPSQSPLWQGTRAGHGGARRALFTGTKGADQLRELRAWVDLVVRERDSQPFAARSSAQAPAPVPRETPSAASGASEEHEAFSPVTIVPVGGRVGSRPDPVPGRPPSAIAAGPTPREVPVSARSASSTTAELPAVDAFDPEVFNRRYVRKKP